MNYGGNMSNNGNSSSNTGKPIETSPNKFLLYGLTYLLATPSDFSKNAMGDDVKVRDFLKKAGIDDNDAQDECIEFAHTVADDKALSNTMAVLHDGLQSDFGDITYSPTPCPNGTDSLSIMRKMNELRKAASVVVVPQRTNR
jgi:hypothetical protein